MYASANINENSIRAFKNNLEAKIKMLNKVVLEDSVRKISAEYDRYTPKLTGKLRQNKNTEVSSIEGGAKLSFKYRQPYARYQYTHTNFNYTTPGTHGYWDKSASGVVNNVLYEN